MKFAQKRLKEQLRVLEIDLDSQQRNVGPWRCESAHDLQQAIEFTKEQISVVQSQLVRCEK